MYYVCAIIKDEHDCIREWADYNLSLGFNKFILYDNNSLKPYDKELGDLVERGIVELRPWEDTRWSRQVRAYNDFVRSGNWSNDDYCAFIDPDEFICFDNARTVAEFMEIYKSYSGVGLCWRTYNASGRIASPNGEIPTIDAYTTEFKYWGPRIKFIARLTDVGDIFSAHAFRPKAGYPPLVTTDWEVITNQYMKTSGYTNGHVKHYITKSWEDWVKRLKRGNITKGLRTVNTFFEFNPDMAHLRNGLTKDLNPADFPSVKNDGKAWDGERADAVRVLLQVDYLTDKIFDVKEYTGDGRGIDAKVSSLNFLESADKEGLDCFYVNGEIEKRTKAPDEFYNKIAEIKYEIEHLRTEEHAAFAEYAQNRQDEKISQRLRDISLARVAKRRELSATKKDRAECLRKILEDKVSNTDFKYYSAICLIIKDDNEYLEEWLNWHIGQGVEHFYIYDHCSKCPVSEFMTSLTQELQDKVTVIDWNGSHDFAQHDAYNNCLKKYASESRWIGFVDSDEMVRVLDGTPLNELLKEFEGYAALFAHWELYGANGRREKSPQPVRERFTKTAKDNRQGGMGKVFAQPYYMRQMLTHNGYPADGFTIVDETHNTVPSGAPWSANDTKTRICVDHYYTKSYEEWLEKISRGRCDPYFSRKYEEFFNYNPDMAYCREEVYPVQEYETGKE